MPLEIYDIYGRRWHSQVIPAGGKEKEIDVSALPPGMYVVRVVIEGQTVSGKLVKE
ncbi:MAG TPA: T9SS type A sorting domain-containing protein [Bacteroidales bacterium]|nr:T9SS type A sorting domain-containing protein [Bacteroidales bacterium]HRZ20632.1 T9SS type A sorting domain-containing protein [Bacteroidales bacterium]